MTKMIIKKQPRVKLGGKKMKILLTATRNSLDLGKKVARAAGLKLAKITIKNFSDGEIWVKFLDNVRGKDVFIIGSTNAPADNLLELLILIDAAKRASAGRISAVIPYYGYGRQERKDQPRTPITAKLVANLIQTAGANRVISMDLHAPAIQGFFDIPFDHLYASANLLPYFLKKKIPNLATVAPDAGSIKRCQSYARHLNTELALIHKKRKRHNQIAKMRLIGSVKNKNVLLLDDMIDTAGTFIDAIKLLKKSGAKKIYGACTHAVLSGRAVQKINRSPLDELVITDTLNHRTLPTKTKIVSMANIFARAIRLSNQNKSVSKLFFENREK